MGARGDEAANGMYDPKLTAWAPLGWVLPMPG